MRSVGNEDDEEEERRILYVAMTRAKNELILTRSESQSSYSFSYGDVSESYFLSTMPYKLTDNYYSHN
jgi:DNA helicase-2/ATP-dependent DNA helicase PcrA